MEGMTKTLPFVLLLVSGGAAFAQSLPMDPAQQRQLTDLQVQQTIQQTQMNNLQVQQSLQQSDIARQQLFNAMPPPAYMPSQSGFTTPPK